MLIQKLAPLHLIVFFITISTTIALLIISSSLVGALGGLNQTQVRKLIAYSSINHLGWILAAIICVSSL